MKKILPLLCASLFCVSCSSGTATKFITATPPPPATAAAWRPDTFYGLGDNLLYWRNKRISNENIIRLGQALGAGTWRYWLMATDVLINPEKENASVLRSIKQNLAFLRECGFTQIIGMSHTWFLPEGLQGDAQSVPRRDLKSGSDYRRFLETYAQTWARLGQLFPEITVWEVGNEMNMDVFLHPLNYAENTRLNTFTREEKALITADMTFAARKALKDVNPAIIVLLPGMSPDGYQRDKKMNAYLEYMYTSILNGSSMGSKNPDDYFDAVAWHPYWFEDNLTGFVSQNAEVYEIIRRYDGDKDVYFTEFGFTDYNNEQKDLLYGHWIAECFKKVKDKMPYVKTMVLFRVLNDPYAAEWAGEGAAGEAAFGVFNLEPATGSISPKKRAPFIQKCFGGTGDLSQFSKP